MSPENVQAFSALVVLMSLALLSACQKLEVGDLLNHRVKRAFRIQQISVCWPAANVVRSQFFTSPTWQEIVLAVSFFLAVSLWVAFVVRREDMIEQQIRELQK